MYQVHFSTAGLTELVSRILSLKLKLPAILSPNAGTYSTKHYTHNTVTEFLHMENGLGRRLLL